MKRREFNQGLSAAAALMLVPFSHSRKVFAATAGGATPIFDYSSGFAGASNAIQLANDTAFNGSLLRLLNNPGHQSSAAWYKTLLPPNAFTTQFTFQPSGLGSTPAAAGMTFCLQNTAVATGAYPSQFGITYAGDANMCGYGGDTTQNPPVNSIAIKFDASPSPGIINYYPASGLPSSTGLYFNGGPSVASGGLGLTPGNDLAPYGINFYSGNTYQVTIVYDGSLLTMVLLDTVTNHQARFAWPLNLANTTNKSGNYVGFTAGSPAQGMFAIHSWAYWSGYNTRLATPTLSPSAGQYGGNQTVAINFPAGSTCYYTTNGLMPTSSSTQYTGPITVSANQVIQAVAIQSGYTDSLVAQAAYQINTSNVINFPSGFPAGAVITAGYAYQSGTAVRVSDTQTNASGAAWFPIPLNIQSFSTAFTLQWNSGASGNGMCFVIQNNPPPYTSSTGMAINWSGGSTAVGFGATALGYGGIGSGTSYGLLNSIAIAFDLYTNANSVGIYTRGATPMGSQVGTGLSFNSGHAFNVSISYSGNTLAFSMTDAVTGAKFTHNFNIDIPSAVGASAAYVGFTGGTGGATAVQSVNAWTYTANSGQTAAVPSPPTNLTVK